MNELLGVNSRLDEIQAAFLSTKLPFLDKDNTDRRRVANRYLAEINNEKLTLPYYDGSENHVFHLFVVQVENRNHFKAYLDKNGVGYLIHYPIPPHLQQALPAFNTLKFPNTEKIHQTVISLPMSPIMSQAQVEKVIQVLNAY